MIAAVAGCAICYWLWDAKSNLTMQIASGVFAGLLCWAALGFLSAALADVGGKWLMESAGATIRTGLICAFALSLTFAGARWNRLELTALLYPTMFLGLAKLLLEDFSQGHAASIALSLLFYGGTLLALPRVRRI